MRTTLIAALTVVSISAHAGVGDFFNDLFGGRFVNPSQVLSAGGDCDAIADTFINTPGRTYKWMGRGDQGRQFLEALDDNVTPDCARRLAYNYAAAIARKGTTCKAKTLRRRSWPASRKITRGPRAEHVH